MSAEEQTVEERRFRIDYVTGQGVEGSFGWSGAPLQVGRGDVGASVPDPTVSNLHATVRAHRGVLEIRDERSRAGVFVEDERLPSGWHPLTLGATAWLGECRVRVMAIDSGDDATVLLSRTTSAPEVGGDSAANEWGSSVLPSPPSATPEATPVVARSSVRTPSAETRLGLQDSPRLSNAGDEADGEPIAEHNSFVHSSAGVKAAAAPQRITPTTSVEVESHRAPRRPWSARARILSGLATLFALACLWYVLLTTSTTS